MAKLAYYWPRMNTDIQNTCDSCASCATYAISRRHESPMEHINLDYGVFRGENYLIICDKLSGFIMCRQTSHQTTDATITALMAC